jgi:hypothetical protein
LRRLSRQYDWVQDDDGGLRPLHDTDDAFDVARGGKVPRALRDRRTCANDSYILETILKKYNRHKIPGGSVKVEVEVWVQEITTISDITSDFQARLLTREQTPAGDHRVFTLSPSHF